MSSILTHATLTNGLVGYWAFEDNLNDSHTNVINGSWVGTSQYGTGKYRRCVASIGVTRHITLTNNALLNPASGITISVWVAFASGFNNQTLVSRMNTPNVLGTYWLGGTPNTGIASEYRFSVGTTVGGCSMDTLQTVLDIDYSFGTTWGHVVGTFDGTTMKFYHNGYFILSKVHGNPGNMYSSADATLIGTEPDGVGGYTNFMGGSVDELAIYNRALTATEVRDLFFTTTPLRYAEVVLPGNGVSVRVARR